MFRAICWYMSKNHADFIHQLWCEEHDMKMPSDDGNNSGAWKRFPVYNPHSTYTFKYKSNEFIVQVRMDDERRQIDLTGEDIKVLKEFTDEVCDQYFELCFGTDTEEGLNLYYYSCSDQCFKPKKLRILKTFENVYLRTGMIENVKKDINEFKANKEFYKKQGIPYKRGYMLYGVPGTGKTSLVIAIATELSWGLYKLGLRQLTEKSIYQAVRMIPPKSVVLIEEIDAHIYNDRRGDSEESNFSLIKPRQNTSEDKQKTKNNDGEKDGLDLYTKMAVSVLMDILDGYEYLNECVVVLTTNNPNSIDEALIRPGRIDLHLEFKKLEKMDIERTIHGFTGYKINVDPSFTISSAELINTILLPNRRDEDAIRECIQNYQIALKERM